LCNKFWVLVITRDPPANAQCISVDSKFCGSDPLAVVFFRLANIPVLFVGCLVSDKLYSKLKRLLGIRVGGAKVIALVVFKTRLGLVVKDGSFDVGG
jgi:hypothetical protein